MLYEKSCRCGAAKKRFKRDIGEYYVGDCCIAAGFDGVGNSKVAPVPVIEAPISKPSLIETVKAAVLPASGRGKLMDMTVPALKELAASKGIVIDESMNKKAIVAAILK